MQGPVEASAAVRECIADQEDSLVDEWREEGLIEINAEVDLDHFRDRAAEMVPDNSPWGDPHPHIQAS